MPVNLPSVKDPKAQKVYLVLGGAAAAFVGYRWWQARKAPAAAVDATLGTGSVTDAPGGGLAPGGNVQYGGAVVGGEVPTTNADWTNRAVELLVQQGWDGATVQATLGKYLSSADLTDAEVSIVQAATAVVGAPPVGSFVIHHAQAPAPSPPAAPEPAPDRAPRPVVTARSNHSVQLHWNEIPGAELYEVEANGSGIAGTGSHRITHVPAYAWSNLAHNHRFYFRVRARTAGGWGPWSAFVNVTTTK